MYLRLGNFMCFFLAASCLPQTLTDKSEERECESYLDVCCRHPTNSTQRYRPTKNTCSMKDNSNGECFPYYLCDSSGTIIIHGIGLLDARVRRLYTTDKCEVKPLNTNPVLSPLTENIECGFRNVDGIGFIATDKNSNDTHFGEFPWTVALFSVDCTKTVEKLTYFCGGSLIHPQVVLTSARCVSQSGQFKVRAGEWDLNSKREIYAHQDRDIAKIIKHPQYNSETLHNDIAILILETPFDKEDNIGVICLPEALEEPPNSNCFATGWGKDQFGKKGQYSTILKLVKLPIVQPGRCEIHLRTARLGDAFELHPSFICAGGEEGIDTCQGDGGSPLVCPVKEKPGYYAQFGIVSWGIGCGRAGTPGVYTHVGAMRNWIDEQLVANKIDMSRIIKNN